MRLGGLWEVSGGGSTPIWDVETTTCSSRARAHSGPGRSCERKGRRLGGQELALSRGSEDAGYPHIPTDPFVPCTTPHHCCVHVTRGGQHTRTPARLNPHPHPGPSPPTHMHTATSMTAPICPCICVHHPCALPSQEENADDEALSAGMFSHVCAYCGMYLPPLPLPLCTPTPPQTIRPGPS